MQEGGGNEGSAVEVHVSVFVVVFDFEMFPIHAFILKNVNPRQKQKLQSLYPFELFRIIVVLDVFNEYTVIQNCKGRRGHAR